MAIDTATKRFSIMDADVPMSPGMTPPDNATPAGDRLAMMWLYSGLGAAAAVFNWIISTNTNGILRSILIFNSGASAVADSGSATSSGGQFSFQATESGLSNGTKRLAFLHNWDSDVNTQSIYGGAAIAQAVEQ